LYVTELDRMYVIEFHFVILRTDYCKRKRSFHCILRERYPVVKFVRKKTIKLFLSFLDLQRTRENKVSKQAEFT